MWSVKAHVDVNKWTRISNALLGTRHAAWAPCLLCKSLIREEKVQVCLSIIQQ